MPVPVIEDQVFEQNVSNLYCKSQGHAKDADFAIIITNFPQGRA